MSNILDELRDQAEQEGNAPGTPEYEERLLGLQVERCQELKHNPCTVCPYVDYCDLAHRFYRMVLSRKRP